MAEPTRIKRTQEQRTALSERLLVEAAVGLLISRGLEGTTLAAIGERSGYSRGLVTHRFGSKAGLFAYVHDTVAMRWIERLNASVGEAVGIEALERTVDALHAFMVDSPDEVRAMYLLRYASIDPGAEYRTNVAKVHKAQRRHVQRWIEAGQAVGSVDAAVNAEHAAELFCAAVDGLLYRWLVNPQLPIKPLHDDLKAQLRKWFGASDGPTSGP